MLQFLSRRLPTWKYWVTLIAIFLPVWTFIGTLSFLVLRNPNSFSVNTPFCNIHYESHEIAYKLEDFNNRLAKEQSKLKNAQTKLKTVIENCIKLNASISRISGSTTLTKQSSELESSFIQSINEVSSIEPIPQNEFDTLRKDLEELKSKIDKAKPRICEKRD